MGEGWMEVRGKRGFTNKEAPGGQYINLAGPVVLLEFVWCLLGVVEFCLVSVGFDWVCLVLFVFVWFCCRLLGFAWVCIVVHGLYGVWLVLLALECVSLPSWVLLVLAVFCKQHPTSGSNSKHGAS